MRYPDVSFDVGDFEALDAATDSLGGLLSWYSLIHQSPEEIQTPLAEFARVIRPGGGLLVGFFEGASVEAFGHAVTTGYRWPVAALTRELSVAGFDVVQTQTRTGNGFRSQGAIASVRRDVR